MYLGEIIHHFGVSTITFEVSYLKSKLNIYCKLHYIYTETVPSFGYYLLIKLFACISMYSELLFIIHLNSK